MCNVGWVDPPIVCDDYEGQKAGTFDHSEPVANRAGRTDVEGCCWWGRGVIQTTGVCNFGKLNYYLGARAAKEGRSAPYGDIDFCKDPGAICSSQEHQELKWIAGMFYWMESVQQYDVGGWNYMTELHAFVDGGYSDPNFINAVSGIVNRGCHNPPCGTGAVDGGPERYHNFIKVLVAFDLIDPPEGFEEGAAGTAGSSPVSSACGTDWKDAEKCSQLCDTAVDCPSGTFCYTGFFCPNSKGKDKPGDKGKGKGTSGVSSSSSSTLPTSMCGADFNAAATCNSRECTTQLDCPAGEYCWTGITC